MKNVSTKEMIQVFGEDEYIKANEAFAGRTHHFAKNLKLMSDEERNRLIVELARATDANYKAIAERFEGLSKSMIYKIVNDGL